MQEQLRLAEFSYGERFREANEITDPAGKKKRLDTLTKLLSNKESVIRKRYGVRLHMRRTKAEVQAEKDRMQCNTAVLNVGQDYPRKRNAASVQTSKASPSSSRHGCEEPPSEPQPKKARVISSETRKAGVINEIPTVSSSHPPQNCLLPLQGIFGYHEPLSNHQTSAPYNDQVNVLDNTLRLSKLRHSPTLPPMGRFYPPRAWKKAPDKTYKPITAKIDASNIWKPHAPSMVIASLSEGPQGQFPEAALQCP